MSPDKKGGDEASGQKLDAWNVAQQQLRNVAELIQLDEDSYRILSTPRVCMTVSVPIRLDSGQIRVFTSHSSDEFQPYGGKSGENAPSPWSHPLT